MGDEKLIGGVMKSFAGGVKYRIFLNNWSHFGVTEAFSDRKRNLSFLEIGKGGRADGA